MFEAGGPENAGSFSFASMKPHQVLERALWNSDEITEVTLSPSRGGFLFSSRSDKQQRDSSGVLWSSRVETLPYLG